MFGRRRPQPTPEPTPQEPSPQDPSEILAAVVAQHLDGAAVEEGTRVVSPALTAQCHVAQVGEMGNLLQAACFFRLSGGRLGSAPVFTSVPGYGPTVEQAVAQGGHGLAVFMSTLLGAADGQELPDGDVERREVVLDGRRYLLAVVGRDQVWAGPDQQPEVRELREALGGTPWFVPGVVGSGRLPLLTGDDATLVSFFVSRWPSSRTVELKVHGVDWPTTGLLDVGFEDLPGPPVAMMRELAMLVPLDPAPPLTREGVQRTLDGLAERREPRQVAGWQGWAAHGGVLGPVLDDAQLAQVEADTGPLPDDLRRFVTQVAGPGAGPGYGLLPLRRVGDRLPLAHAGCGNTWVLVLEGEERGTVRIDASGSGAQEHQVASSFGEWFTDWLEASLRDADPWVQYDIRGCASVAAMSRVLTSREEHAATTGELVPRLLEGLPDGAFCMVGETTYLPHGPLDPCHGCVALAASLGVAPTVFAPGVLSGATV